jgi:hypothetical protein
MRWWGILFLSLAIVLGAATETRAQTASVSGTVSDPSGAAIPGATVTIINTGTNLKLERQTAEDGSFLFPQLPVGPYEMRIAAAGFQPHIRTGIILVVDQAAAIPVTLKVGSTSESITVTADADLLNVSSPTLSQVIEERRIEALPLNGRNPAALVFLTAGVENANDGKGGAGGSAVFQANNSYPTSITVAANGARGGSTHFTLDGVLNLDNYQMAGAPFPNPDSTQEFSVLTSSFSSRYGFAAGGIVNVVTRSGTNQFHGSIFEFARNGVFNARNFFAPRHDNMKRDQFGGTAGFPIVRDRLFFFGAYQGTRLRSTDEGVQRNVLTNSMRRGDFSALLPRTQLRSPFTGQPYPNNQIPATDFSPTALNILKLIPESETGLIVTTLPARYREDEVTLKTDFNRGSHRYTWRYFLVDYDEPGMPTTTDLTRAVFPCKRRFQSFLFADTWTFSPNKFNDLRVSYSRLLTENNPSLPISPKSLGVKMTEGEIPFIQTLSVAGLGISGGTTRNHFPRWNFTIDENFSWMRGRHQLSFGAQAFRMVRLSEGLNGQNGAFQFTAQYTQNGYADFLVGAMWRFAQNDGFIGDIHGGLWGFYVQDDFRATPNLTLNFGLRYDPHFPYHEKDGRQICWRPGGKSSVFTNAPAGYLAAGDPGCPAAGTEPDLNNIQPRIGFAYNVAGRNVWSLRGGYGIYYQPLGTFYNTVDLGQTPFARSLVVTAGNKPLSLDDPWRDVPGGDPYAKGFQRLTLPPRDIAFPTATYAGYTWPERFRLSYIQNWNLSLERAIGRNMMLRAAYVGSKGTRLSYSADINAPLPSPTATAGNTEQRRPYRQFSNFYLYDNGGNSNYNAGQLTFQKRHSAGLTLLASYTFSKSIDETSINASFFRAVSALVNPFDRRMQRAVSDFDVRHAFRSSVVWSLPRFHSLPRLASTLLGNWSANGIGIWRGGQPFTVTSGQDRSFTTGGLDWADLVPGRNPRLPSDRAQGDKVRRWFNTDAFALAAPNTFGNSGRNSMLGPGRFNIDLGVTRSFRLTELLRLQFRAEFFNVLNHTQLGPPISVWTNARLGEITAAAEPRILQFAAKIQW